MEIERPTAETSGFLRRVPWMYIERAVEAPSSEPFLDCEGKKYSKPVEDNCRCWPRTQRARNSTRSFHVEFACRRTRDAVLCQTCYLLSGHRQYLSLLWLTRKRTAPDHLPPSCARIPQAHGAGVRGRGAKAQWEAEGEVWRRTMAREPYYGTRVEFPR